MIKNETYLADVDKISNADYNWSKIDGHSFLIIGATGMIGSCMIDVLMYRNRKMNAHITIHAMGRSQNRLSQRFAEYRSDKELIFLEGDVTNPISENIKVDYIIHGASNTHPKAYSSDPIGTIMTNIIGTENVLKLAVTSDAKRCLFLSTVEVYGENRGDVEMFKEDYCGYIDCNTLRAGYTEGKRVSESLCQAYIEKYDVDVVIPRIARTFGPTMLLNDSKASSQFILDAVHNENIVLKSEGNQYYSYAYVFDIVSSLLFLLIYGKKGEAYNIASEQYNIHLKNFAKKLANYVNKQVVYELPDDTEKKGFSKATMALMNAEKLSSLGWESKFSFNEAIDHTVNILKNEIK
ncbi:NAD-dependent epimerase/dehydratase family protein [Enterococcus dongliensis]|uniref:NAD-dependent epimerase/dehydratase family protein n=1 Tax=Enterococcus dongliensis TaxID=2559925 RepID=UPI00288CA74A|nr:NAD-dependent epimerase/dehydratase family protein [Enterococcus dongliensis]MDT2670804.1 NAD-dependent epimerase/dehydratase family protein [Enterococcus dongliensis]